jgi:hypothetical protein
MRFIKQNTNVPALLFQHAPSLSGMNDIDIKMNVAILPTNRWCFDFISKEFLANGT